MEARDAYLPAGRARPDSFRCSYATLGRARVPPGDGGGLSLETGETMKQTTIAVAIALLAVSLAAGVTPVPGAAVSQDACDRDDFSIPGTPQERTLGSGADEVGTVSVGLLSEDLVIELTDRGADGILEWSVMVEDGNDCVVFDQDPDCQGQLQSEDQPVTCELAANDDYHVLVEEISEKNQIKYEISSS